MEYKRVNNDVNGNPRYVFHFFSFINDNDRERAGTGLNYVINLKDIALKKARKIGGRKYRGRDFGGGIVLQSYNIRETVKQIEALKNE